MKNLKIYEPIEYIYVLTTGSNRSAIVVDTNNMEIHKYVLARKSGLIKSMSFRRQKPSNTKIEALRADIERAWYAAVDGVENTKIGKFLFGGAECIDVVENRTYDIVVNKVVVATVYDAKIAEDIRHAIGNRNKDYSVESIIKLFPKKYFTAPKEGYILPKNVCHE